MLQCWKTLIKELCPAEDGIWKHPSPIFHMFSSVSILAVLQTPRGVACWTREFSAGLSVALEDVTVAGRGPIPTVCLHASSALVHREGCGSLPCRGEGAACNFRGSFQTLLLCCFPHCHSWVCAPFFQKDGFCTSFLFLPF